MNAFQNLLEAGPCISVPITVINAPLFDEILKQYGNAAVESSNLSDRPQFDSMTGELTFRGELIREYAKRAKNVVAVLNALETACWPRCIGDPLPGGKNAERINNTVRSLNRGLMGIKFHAGGDGMSIRWKVQK
jgi:hypothetical protein